MTLFSSAVLPLVPYDSSVLLAQEYGGVTYIELMKYSFFPLLLLIVGILVIQIGLINTKSEKKEGEIIGNN